MPVAGKHRLEPGVALAREPDLDGHALRLTAARLVDQDGEIWVMCAPVFWVGEDPERPAGAGTQRALREPLAARDRLARCDP